MRKLLTAVLAAGLALATVARADEAEAGADVKAASAKVKNEKLRDHLLQNVDIFGKNDLPAIYILAPGEFADEEIKGQLLARDFSRDPFFMQNIDREEFELKIILRDFKEDDKSEASQR
ncbi:MAG TPA: hypothetical protein VK465_16270 [Fibrobacteria bacterium]|nr:hypothetical protein [Fibrobacteria bacterium]